MNITQWLFAHSLEITGYLLAILLIPRILLERRHPGATIAWVLAVGLVPFVGVPLYFLIGGRRIKKVSRKKNWSMPLGKANLTTPALGRLPPYSRKIAYLMMQAGIFPPSEDNSIDIIDDGIKAYTTLFNMLEGAEKSIEIATFILGPDGIGKAFIRLLAKKAGEGLEVRLLLDGLGSMRTSGHFVDPLRNAGGQIGIFLPIIPIRRRWSANLRNHRKLAVVDGYKAFIGGMNIAQEYMGPKPYKKRWKDVSMLTWLAAHTLMTLCTPVFVFIAINPACCMQSFTVDRKLAVVGSANMDIRSFQLNFEIASFLYDSYFLRIYAVFFLRFSKTKV